MGMKRIALVLVSSAVAISACSAGSVIVDAGSVSSIVSSVVEPDTESTTTALPAQSTTVTSVANPIAVDPADRLPGLGRSAAAVARDSFLAGYQVYLRELGLHECMQAAGFEYALEAEFSDPSFARALREAAEGAGNLGPLESDEERAELFGPVEFDQESGEVIRVNLDSMAAMEWNARVAQDSGDSWWLARYGFTAAEVEFAESEAGIEPGGCDEHYWEGAQSVWDLRNKMRPLIDDVVKLRQAVSFEECRSEFGLKSVDLGELEGSASGEFEFFEECLARWDDAVQSARLTDERELAVQEVEALFADEIEEQKAQLDRASSDVWFISLLLA